eukprot:COSAG03_NODE_3597_length_1929_cov_0.974863_3_plen_100_part_00
MAELAPESRRCLRPSQTHLPGSGWRLYSWPTVTNDGSGEHLKATTVTKDMSTLQAGALILGCTTLLTTAYVTKGICSSNCLEPIAKYSPLPMHEGCCSK